LKPFASSQARNHFQWFNDPEVTKFLSRDFKGYTLNKAKEYIRQAARKKDAIRWAIYLKDGTHVGNTALHEIDGRKDKKACWGICIGDKNYWGQGLGTDTLKAILKFSFDKLKLHRLELSVFPHNPRGLRCYKKCGFKVEGLKRQSVKKNGKFIDEIIMSILKSDYNKLIK
jgi:RimJ/RimL family protein N-acetyltransferase